MGKPSPCPGPAASAQGLHKSFSLLIWKTGVNCRNESIFALLNHPYQVSYILCACCAKSLPSCPLARQAPLSVGFSRQEHWSGLPCPPAGGLPNPGIEHTPLTSCRWGSLPLGPPSALKVWSLSQWTAREVRNFVCCRK